MLSRSIPSITFEPVNSIDPCKTIVQSNLNVKKDATLKCDLDVKKCLNVKNVVYCEEIIDETCQNISSDISLTWVNTNGEGYLEEGKKDGMYKKIVKTVTGTTSNWLRVGDFSNNYLNKTIASIALDPNDEKNIYVSGFFDGTFGNTALKYVAKYTKSTNTWSPVGNIGDFNNWGIKIIFNPVTGEGPYVGGFFTQVGGDPNLNYLVKWDGSGWTSVKSGGDQIVGVNIEDILFTPGGSGPYICGRFSQIGGTATNSIAYFDGTNWITNVFRPESVTFANYKMTIDNAGNQLLVTSGNFLDILGFNFPLDFAGYISTSARIYSISTSPNDIVYIGTLGIPGEYIDGITGLYLAKYDYSSFSWTSVSGQTGEFNNRIYNISFEKNCENPYVGGYFTQIDGNPNLNFLTKWNGFKWTSINPIGDDILFNPNGTHIRDIKFSSDYNNIYVGGFFINFTVTPIQIGQYTRQTYNLIYNKGTESELLIDEGDCVSFIYNEDLEEWIKLN
jgi:hypothetical protein